ncbi:MAG: hypothetical protein R3Y53_11355 [Bacillota bacterium]
MHKLSKALADLVHELHRGLSHTGLPLEFFEMVLQRLFMFRYKIVKEDSYALRFAVLIADQKVRTYCNIITIPKEVLPKLADISVGIFLEEKLQNGQLNLGDLDLSSVVAVKEGDTSVTFGASASDKISALFCGMTSVESGELSCYRKLKW